MLLFLNHIQGTVGSIWINGTFDLQIGAEADMVACARSSTSCCSAAWDIRIKKCQEFSGATFNVYRLRRPPSCPMAYCAGKYSLLILAFILRFLARFRALGRVASIYN